MKRKSTIFLIVMLLLILQSVNFYASEDDTRDDDVILRYEYVSYINSTLKIISKTATCKSIITGRSGVTKIIVTQKLQKKVSGEWTNVKTWSKTANTSATSFTNSKSSLSSGTYRTRTVAKVYKNSNYETVSKNSDSVKIS